jgi:hypothetical protein
MGPGGEAQPKHFTQKPIRGANNWGVQLEKLDPDCLACEGGQLSRFANQIWWQNALAGLHDTMQVQMSNSLLRDITNVPFMIPAALFTYGAAFGQMLNLMQSPIYIYRAPRKDRDGKSTYQPPIIIW